VAKDEQAAAANACQVEPNMIHGIPVAIASVSGDMKTLKWTSDTLSNQHATGIAIVCSAQTPNQVVVKQGKSCKAPGAALAILQAIIQQFGGKGGGARIWPKRVGFALSIQMLWVQSFRMSCALSWIRRGA
jgi:alanyl-tRNA synthetase